MVIHKKRDKALRGSLTRTYLAWNVRQQNMKSKYDRESNDHSNKATMYY